MQQRDSNQGSGHGTDSPEAIEAALARDRAQLSDSISALRTRMSTEALLDDAAGLLKQRLMPTVRFVDETVRAKPLAAAVAGVGIAWLMLGRRSQPTVPTEPLAGTKYEALTRWEDEGGPVAQPPEPDDDDWIAETDSLRARALDALDRLERGERAQVISVTERAAQRASVLADLSRGVQASLRRGLGQLSEAAQDRVATSRARAYLAAVRADGGRRVIEDHPLAVGAVAWALGAALGAALPRSKVEDRFFGPERDRLLAEAAEALRRERQRAEEGAANLAESMSVEVHNAAGRLTDAVA